MADGSVEAELPPTAVTIIALDDPSGAFTYAYADGRGVRRVYWMSLSDGGWRIWGQAGPEFFQQFTATVSGDAKSISGHWDRSRDGTSWERDAPRPDPHRMPSSGPMSEADFKGSG
jgi:hypothetical protein